MKENLLSAIKAHDFTAIRTICFALSEEERTATLALFEYHTIKALFEEELKKQGITYIPKSIDTILSYALMCLCRNAEELKAAELNIRIRNRSKEHYCYFLDTQYAVPLLELLQSPKGAYLQEIIEKMYKAYPMEMSFEILWTLYKHKRIAFNGELMMFNLHYRFDTERDKIALAKYLLQNPETATEIFHLVPMYLKDARFNAKETLEMYEYLIQGGFFADRTIISLFIEGLLNPLKKNTADFFCRVVELLNPITKELLTSQHTLFALLSSDKTSVINFAMKFIKQIANEKAFDFQAFADNFALCFTIQKIAKSQLIGVEILEKYYQKQAPTNPDYREQLAVLFTVPDVKLQEKVAALLTTYFNHEGLPEVIAPYRDYLKGKAQNLLQSLPSPSSSENSENSENSQTARAARTSHSSQTARTLTPVPCPLTPEDLLFLLGDCLRERTPQTIDLFFEGFNQLQDDFPADFKEQLAPYLKQLERHWNGIASVPILRWFLQRWTGDKKKLNKEDETFFLTTLPYLYHKAQHLLEKLKEKNKLPFLSTPTHAPFYIEAEVLMDRLLQYEAQGENPDLHDLVVACNRLLFKEVSAAAKEKAQQLKGAYTPAIQYYIGLTDKVQPTEELLPLWTQITRIKHPDGEFVEFANTSAKDFPTVVKPFMIDFWMKTRKQSDVTFHYLNLEDNWNNNFDMKQKPTKYPFPYYNTGNSRKGWETDKLYQCSLNPHYPEAQILRYIASYAKGNESYQIEYMQTSMQVLLENHLPIYHSGWLFVAVALLFEKKPTRDMAAAYILEHLEYGTNLNLLAQYIGKLLAEQYAPIARFVEFLDIPTRDPKIKAFQKNVVEAYLPLAEKLEKKPTNHKKLVTYNL